MGWWQRVRTNASGKDKSLATGVALGFMAWTLMRLVDSISAYDTLEYDITNKPTTLADGRAGFAFQVKLTNLAGDTTVEGLKATVASSTADIDFSMHADDYRCPVQPPAGGKVVECTPHVGGFNFSAPPLLAGTFAGLEVKYTRPATSSETPYLRIVLAEGQNFRLVEAGVATALVRNQTGILIAFLVLAAISLLISLAVGVMPPPKTE
jgi:hypothetical protein